MRKARSKADGPTCRSQPAKFAVLTCQETELCPLQYFALHAVLGSLAQALIKLLFSYLSTPDLSKIKWKKNIALRNYSQYFLCSAGSKISGENWVHSPPGYQHQLCLPLLQEAAAFH